MKILFISSSLPPNYDSQTIRNIHFIRGLFKHSIVVDTLTVSDSTEVDDKQFLDITSVNYYTKAPILLRFLDSLKFKPLKYFFHNIMNYLVAPDLYVFWPGLVLDKHLTEFRGAGYDAIISTSGTYLAHVLARKLHEELNVPYICDLGDPWADNPIWPENMYHKRKINERLENYAIEKCILITTTNDSTSSLYKSKYRNKDIISVSMGYNYRETKLNKISKCEDIVLCYVGVAYKKSRDLSYLIDAVSRFRQCVLQITGPHSSSFDKQVLDKGVKNVFIRSKVSYLESERLVDESDVSVAIGNTGGLQIPGKLYSLIGVPKPILYIVQESNDASLKVLDGMSGIVVVNNDAASITLGLNQLFENFDELVQGSIDRVNSDRVKSFEWNSISNRFAVAIKNTIENS